MDVPSGTIQMEGHLPLAGCAPGTALELIEVQVEGKKRMSGRDFVNGYRPYNGELLGEAQPLGA
jgi:methionyl-tRNA formyltransferase